MPWNIPVFDSAGKIKDARLSNFKTITGTPAINTVAAAGITNIAGDEVLSFPRLSTIQISGWNGSQLDALPGGFDGRMARIAQHDIVLIGIWRQWDYSGATGPDTDASDLAIYIKTFNANCIIYFYTFGGTDIRETSNAAPWPTARTKWDDETWYLYDGTGMVFPDDVKQPTQFADYQGNHSDASPLDSAGVSPAEWAARSFHAASGDSGDWATGGFGYKPAHGWDGIYQDIMRAEPRIEGDWDRDGSEDAPGSATALAGKANGDIAYHAEWDILEPGYLHSGNYTKNGGTDGNPTVALADYNQAIASGYKELVNAPLLEGIMGLTSSLESFGGWDKLMLYYKRGMTFGETLDPQHVMFGMEPRDPEVWEPTQTLTDFGRYGLCCCLQDNGYFGISAEVGFQDAVILNEYDFNLGDANFSPKYDGADPTVSTTGSGYTPDQLGVYWREFVNGIAVVNPKSNGQQTITLPSAGTNFRWDRLGADDFDESVQDTDVNDGAIDITTQTLPERHGIIIKRVSLLNIFVSDTGSDSNSGTEVSPYLTLQKAVDVAVPGSIIEMQKDGGGTWTYTNYTTFDIDGTDGNEITLRVRSGDRVNFYPTSGGIAVWDFDSGSYWVLDGTIGEMHVGDRSEWTGTNGGTETYLYNHSLRAQNTPHHVKMDTIHFSGGFASQAMRLENTMHHWHFDNCTGGGMGRMTDTDGHSDDGMVCAGTNILITNCDWSAPFGGHNMMSLFGNSIVCRNVTMNNDWTREPSWDQNSDAGYRVFSKSVNLDGAPWSFASSPWGPALFEDCTISNTGWQGTAGSGNNAAYQAGARRTIFRYNYVFDSRSDQAQVMQTALPQPADQTFANSAEFLRSYNNTYDNCANFINVSAGTTSGGDNFNLQELFFKNNIASNIKEQAYSGFNPHFIFWLNGERLDLEGHPDAWKGAIFAGNMLDSDGYSIRLHPPTAVGAATVSSLAAAITEWPNVFLASNNTNAPTYVNPGLKTKAGFALDTGSNGIDEAVEITNVTANSSGTAVTLEDCYWIFDGFDLGYFGEVGDYIAFYNAAGDTLKGIRQVSNVNSKTSITLTSSITIVIGDIVFPVLPDGTTVVDNMGAAQ